MTNLYEIIETSTTVTRHVVIARSKSDAVEQYDTGNYTSDAPKKGQYILDVKEIK